MRALILIHRWLGIACCLLFAMWFASGMVMHFVPFPQLTSAERFAGLSPIPPGSIHVAPGRAAQALPGAVERLRLVMRGSRPQYVFEQEQRMAGVYADDGTPAGTVAAREALQLALEHARNRGLEAGRAQYAELAAYDQWTVPNGLDNYRPLHRIRLNDDLGTEVYVSAVTGEVVRDTTRFERAWNYAGAVAHWIYPTALRMHWAAWDATVWWLSLIALVGASTGLVLGVWRARWRSPSRLSPFRGMLWWHHLLGLACAIFVLTWIFSGWLSMDHGRLFSMNTPRPEEITSLGGGIADMRRFDALPLTQADGAREIEFVLLGGTPYLRARATADDQFLVATAGRLGNYFSAAAITAATRDLGSVCAPAGIVPGDDAYYVEPSVRAAPLYRAQCSDAAGSWFHIDGASGRIMEKVDASRRWYRWMYSGLHTFDMPWLINHAGVRSVLIVVLCSLGLVFSVSGVIVGWRRLQR